MVDFVLEQHETETLDTSQIMWYDKEVEKLCKIRNYANFLKKPLEIWQFVPCKLVDGVWVVLEKKKPFQDNYYEYQEAKSRCLFEGFVYDSKMEYWYNNDIGFDEEYIENKTIEDLVKYNLELTASAIKEFGL